MEKEKAKILREKYAGSFDGKREMRLEPDDLEKVARLAEEALYWYFFKRKDSPLLSFKPWFKDYDFKVTLVKKT